MEQLKVYGAIEELRLIRDRQTGESRGFAFVDFFSIEEAKTVKKLS